MQKTGNPEKSFFAQEVVYVFNESSTSNIDNILKITDLRDKRPRSLDIKIMHPSFLKKNVKLKVELMISLTTLSRRRCQGRKKN